MSNEPMAEPRASRLILPRGYEVAERASLLTWPDVEDRLVGAANYWLTTMRPDRRPHATPIWGVWLERALYLDGIPTARWARNMAANPAVTVHLESGTDVVIIDGFADNVPSITNRNLAASIVAIWDSKYGRLHPDPGADGMYRVMPRSVRAWRDFPHDATRWLFDDT